MVPLCNQCDSCGCHVQYHLMFSVSLMDKFMVLATEPPVTVCPFIPLLYIARCSGVFFRFAIVGIIWFHVIEGMVWGFYFCHLFRQITHFECVLKVIYSTGTEAIYCRVFFCLLTFCKGDVQYSCSTALWTERPYAAPWWLQWIMNRVNETRDTYRRRHGT